MGKQFQNQWLNIQMNKCTCSKNPQNRTPDDSENPFKADGANSHFVNENEVNETFPIRNIPLTTKLRSNHERQKWISKIEFASQLSFFFETQRARARTNGQINSIRGTGTCLPVTRKLCAFCTFCKTLFTRCREGIVPPGQWSRYFPAFLTIFVLPAVVLVFISIPIRSGDPAVCFGFVTGTERFLNLEFLVIRVWYCQYILQLYKLFHSP